MATVELQLNVVFRVPILSWKLSVLEIPLDKEPTANPLVETCTKLEELILAVMVKYGLTRKGRVELQSHGGIVHLKSLLFFVVLEMNCRMNQCHECKM